MGRGAGPGPLIQCVPSGIRATARTSPDLLHGQERSRHGAWQSTPTRSSWEAGLEAG